MIQRNSKECTYYYRIIYKGIVALVSSPLLLHRQDDPKDSSSSAYNEFKPIQPGDENEIETENDHGIESDPSNPISLPSSHVTITTTNHAGLTFQKTGVYVSYGEIISTHEDILEVTQITVGKKSHHLNRCERSHNELEEESQSQMEEPREESIGEQEGDTILKYYLIRVNHILTGGYAIDGEAMTMNSSFSISSSCSQQKTRLETETENTIIETDSIASFSPESPLLSTSSASDSSSHDVPLQPTHCPYRPNGYLLICMTREKTSILPSTDAKITISSIHHPWTNRMTKNPSDHLIVESIPYPPLLCQTGQFFYKVLSSTPLPILVGPSIDAPSMTHEKIMPQTVQEIHLRIGSVAAPQEQDHPIDPEHQMKDGIVFLRLSHKRGWIADRSSIPTYLNTKNDEPRPPEDPTTKTHLTHKMYPLVVKDITHLVEAYGAMNPTTTTTSASDSTILLDRDPFETLKNTNHHHTSMSSTLSSISSSFSTMSTMSIHTPAHVLNMRQRKRMGSTTMTSSTIIPTSSKIMPNAHSNLSNDKMTHVQKDTSTNMDHTSIKSNPIQDRFPSTTKRVKDNFSQDDRMDSVHVDTNTRMASSTDLSQPSKILTENNDLRTMDNNSPNHMVMKTTTKKYPSLPSNTLLPILKPNIFLIRVHAPLGLKILDAPHFQVNHLIRRPSTTVSSAGSNVSNPILPSIPPSITGTVTSLPSSGVDGNIHRSTGIHAKKIQHPSAIFCTMAGSIGHKPSHTVSWELEPLTGKRILPRGSIFEASTQLEKASMYGEAMGLIKLADNTGWAIIPTIEELETQYSSQSNNNNNLCANVDKNHSILQNAYEEIGNAFVENIHEKNETSCNGGRTSGLWLRVVHPDGVIVSCASTKRPSREPDCRHLQDILKSRSLESSGDSKTPSIVGCLASKSQDSETTTVGSVFDAFRSSSRKKKTRSDTFSCLPTTGSSQMAHGINANSADNSVSPLLRHGINQHFQLTMNPIIPCGMPVEVERSKSTNNNVDQKYVRICGNQGWIPQINSQGICCAVPISPPNINYGSFWFQVLPKNGIQVRLGPSQRAGAIKSNDDVYFRFECGEFLRASEILTLCHVDDTDDSEGSVTKAPVNSEVFAKLYRRASEELSYHASEAKSAFIRPLSSIISPGEWVPVRYDDEEFLEECVNPPVMQRHREGWKYEIVHQGGIYVRQGPSFKAEETGVFVKEGEVIFVNECVRAHSDEVTWLRLKNGKGWVHDTTQDYCNKVAVALVCSGVGVDSSTEEVKETKQPSYSKIFGRIF